MDDPLMELRAQIEETNREIEGLKLENEVFKNYLERAEPAQDENEVPVEGRKAWRARRRNLPQKLTMDQKCEIANFEQERLIQEIADNKKASEKLADTLRAVLEETDIRIAELKKDAYEFKRDIVVGAENMRTGKTMAEKMTRYMEEKLRQRDSVIEKLRLKNSTIKAQLQKVEAQLKQKEEMGDVLHYIDFHQLQIENKQYQAKIEERNEDLLRLKLTTGRTVASLNTLKKKMATVVEEAETLEREIGLRADQLRKVKDEVRAVAADSTAERRVRKRLSQQQAEATDMPSTLDYVAQKAKMYEFESTLRNWERKVEIMEMAAKKARNNATRNGATTRMTNNTAMANHNTGVYAHGALKPGTLTGGTKLGKTR